MKSKVVHSAPHSDNTTTKPAPFRLLDLPAEIRLLIYHHVFTTTQVGIIGDKHPRLQFLPAGSLLLANNQLHAETQHIFWHQVTLDFSSTDGSVSHTYRINRICPSAAIRSEEVALPHVRVDSMSLLTFCNKSHGAEGSSFLAFLRSATTLQRMTVVVHYFPVGIFWKSPAGSISVNLQKVVQCSLMMPHLREFVVEVVRYPSAVNRDVCEQAAGYVIGLDELGKRLCFVGFGESRDLEEPRVLIFKVKTMGT